MRRVLTIVHGIVFGTLVFVGPTGGSAEVARAEVARDDVTRADVTGATVRNLASEPVVTVYGATWCSACKALERELRNRTVPFNLVDIDQNPREYEAAKRATGKSVVPITRVTKTEEDVVWVVGADADTIEKAYRGE
jgi:glutaredoxin